MFPQQQNLSLTIVENARAVLAKQGSSAIFVFGLTTLTATETPALRSRSYRSESPNSPPEELGVADKKKLRSKSGRTDENKRAKTQSSFVFKNAAGEIFPRRKANCN